MSTDNPSSPMEHDGLSSIPVADTSSPRNPVVSGDSASAAPSPTTPQAVGIPAVPDGVPNTTHGTRVVGPRRNSNVPSSTRIFCPVVGCPEALASSSRYFRDFSKIRIHLNDHCTGHLSGAVPVAFLTQNDYSQCNVCDKILHKKFNGTCPKCRPRVRLQSQINIMRRGVNIQHNNSSDNQQSQQVNDSISLPSLSVIHERYVPTIKNIPKVLRSLFAQCLTKALAQAVWTNNDASWTELQMLPKCTLCSPIRGGKAHYSKRLAWTRGRLTRWLAGERFQLWQDLPQYKPPKPKRL